MNNLVPLLIDGAAVTIQIALASTTLALLIAFPMALGRISKPLPLRWACICYIELFRGTSLVVQLFWIYFVLPHFGITLPSIAAGILGIALNYGAYGSEIVRGAIQSVDKGQREAAFSLRLTRFQTFRLVIFPQAMAIFIRPWGNLMIQLLKATSLVSMITISDLTYRAYQYNQLTMHTFQTFGAVLVIYFVIAQCLSFATNKVDGYFARWRTPHGAGT